MKFKGHLYYEEKDYVSEAEKKLKTAKGSQVQPISIFTNFSSIFPHQFKIC